MRIRYDLYGEFDEPQDDAGETARTVAKDSFGDGVMGISASSLHEDDYILTTMLFLDPALIFNDIESDFPTELPDDMESRLEGEVTMCEDVAVQRVVSD